MTELRRSTLTTLTCQDAKTRTAKLWFESVPHSAAKTLCTYLRYGYGPAVRGYGTRDTGHGIRVLNKSARSAIFTVCPQAGCLAFFWGKLDGAAEQLPRSLYRLAERVHRQRHW